MAIKGFEEQRRIQAPNAAIGQAPEPHKIPSLAEQLSPLSDIAKETLEKTAQIKFELDLRKRYSDETQLAEEAYTRYAAGINDLNAGLEDALSRGVNVYEYQKKYEKEAKKLQEDLDNSLNGLTIREVYDKFKEQENDFNLSNSYNYKVQTTKADFKIKSESKAAYIATNDNEFLKSLDGITDATQLANLASNYINDNRNTNIDALHSLQGLSQEVAKEAKQVNNSKFLESVSDYIAQQETFQPNFKGYNNVYKFLNSKEIGGLVNQDKRNELFSKYELEDLKTRHSFNELGDTLQERVKNVNVVGKHLTPEQKASFLAGLETNSKISKEQLEANTYEYKDWYAEEAKRLHTLDILSVGEGNDALSETDWEDILNGKKKFNEDAVKSLKDADISVMLELYADHNRYVNMANIDKTAFFKNRTNLRNLIAAKKKYEDSKLFSSETKRDTSVRTSWSLAKNIAAFWTAPNVRSGIEQSITMAIADENGKVDMRDYLSISDSVYGNEKIKPLLNRKRGDISEQEKNDIRNILIETIATEGIVAKSKGYGIFANINGDITSIEFFNRSKDFLKESQKANYSDMYFRNPTMFPTNAATGIGYAILGGNRFSNDFGNDNLVLIQGSPMETISPKGYSGTSYNVYKSVNESKSVQFSEDEYIASYNKYINYLNNKNYIKSFYGEGKKYEAKVKQATSKGAK